MGDGILLFIAVFLVLSLFVCEHLGALAARRRSEAAELEDRVSHIVTSAFGLLALLIGFTFSIALNRYDTRRIDVIQEANAIGTAHYRAGLVEPLYGKSLQDSLIAYSRVRLAYGKAGPAQRPGLEVRSSEMRDAIGRAGESMRPIANTPLGTSTIASVNEVLDQGGKREANMNSRIPWTVFAVLIGIACIAAGMMGFAYPTKGRIQRATSLILFAMLAMTIVVILDLDRPARGSITIDQSPLANLVAGFDRATAKRDKSPDPGRRISSRPQIGRFGSATVIDPHGER